MFNLKFSKQSARFLEKCDKILYERIIKKLKELQNNPFPRDAKRVVGKKDKTFRVRVGDYRILYVLFRDDNDLFIADIDKRTKIYD